MFATSIGRRVVGKMMRVRQGEILAKALFSWDAFHRAHTAGSGEQGAGYELALCKTVRFLSINKTLSRLQGFRDSDKVAGQMPVTVEEDNVNLSACV